MLKDTDDHFTDRALIKAASNGDMRAFGSIIEKTEGLVTQIIFKMVLNSADRKDMLQEVYLKIFKNLPTFKFQAKLSTWAASITYHTCFDYLKRKRLVLLEDYAAHELVVSGETERGLMNSELSLILSMAMERLSPVYQTLITLYHHEELSYEEITEVTGLPAGTVKNYLFRARAALKQSVLKNYKREEL